MALTPKQVYELTAEDKQKATQFELVIDRALQSHAKDRRFGTELWVYVTVPQGLREYIKDLYIRAGWNVRYHDDQRDGTAMVFTPSNMQHSQPWFDH